MSKVVNYVIAGALIVAGTILEFVPGGQALGTQFIITGVTMLASALLQPKGKPRDASETTLQLGEVPRAGMFGEGATAGSLVDAFNYGGDDGTDWEVVVIALADHRCEALTGFYVNDKFEAYVDDGTVDGYSGQLEVYWRHGTEDQAAPSILTDHGPGWIADDSGAGVAYVVVAYKADKPDAKHPVWPGGRPRFLWVLKGALCYDARADDSVDGGDGDQSWDDPATRVWSDNLIVCRYTWVRGLYACDRVDQPDMLLIGRGLSDVEAPPANMFAAANLCDEEVDGEARYRIDGIVAANETFIDVEEKFAASCAGIIIQREGAVEIEPAQARTPVLTITDADLVVGSSVEYNQDILSEADNDWVNTVIPRYVEPAQQYADHGAPLRRDVDDVIADGGPREQSVSLPMVKRAAQAGRVGEVARRMGRIWGRGTITLPPRFAMLEEGDWIDWQSDRRFGGDTKTFRIEAYSLDQKWHNQLTLREISSAVYEDGDFLEDLAVAEQQDAPGEVGAPDGAAWTLTAEMLDDGGPAIPILAIAGAVELSIVHQVRFEYWRDDGATDPEDVDDWVARGTFGAGTKRVEISDIASGADYYAAVSYVVGGIPGGRLILGPVTAGSITGTEGPPGADGAAGLNNALVFIFKRSASAPTLPSATATYTFATGGITGLNNGWTAAVPAPDGNPLYVSVATASAAATTDTIGSGEWASAVIMSQDGATGATGSTGAAGTNAATVFLYQRAASAPSVPGSTTTYTFATGVLSGTLGSWTQSVPAGSNPLYVTTATALGTGSTDTIATGEWATPAIMAQDGATGATGLSVAIVKIYKRSASTPSLPTTTGTFTFSTGAITGLDNGWTIAVPAANGTPLYVSAATASATGATDTIAAAEWATPVIEAQDGATGATGSTGAAGSNAATVFLFQRSATNSAPAVPSGTLTYTFATGVLASITGGWTQADPGEASGAFLFVTTATALGTGSTDTIATGEWASPRLTAHATTDRQILTLDKKIETLLTKVAALGNRYTQVSARATALGISTSAASTSRTSLLSLLAGLSPAYNDVTQDTTLASSLFAAGTFPTNWVMDGATNAANGIYRTLTDSNASYNAAAEQTFTTTGSQTYTAAIVVAKDAVAGTTRTPCLLIVTSAGTLKIGYVQFNSQTGAIVTASSLSDSGVVSLNDTEWLVWATMVLNANNTSCYVSINPAFGTTSGQNSATTGSIDMRDPIVVLGSIDKAGRDALNWRLKDYEAQLDALDKAISEIDSTSSLTIDGPSVFNVNATSAGDASANLPVDLGFSAKVGTTSVTTSASWARTVTSASGSITCTIGAATGTLDITALTTDTATVRIDCTYNGIPVSKTVTINRINAVASSGGGTSASASTSTFTSINSTTFTTIATLVITAGSAGPVLSAPGLACVPSTSGGTSGSPWNVEMKWVRENGVTDVDIGSTANSNPDPEIVTDAEGHITRNNGAITCNATDSGRSVGVQYTYYLMAKETSGTRSINFTGTASVSS